MSYKATRLYPYVAQVAILTLRFDYHVIIPYKTLIVYQVPHVCHLNPIVFNDAYISTYCQ